MLYYRFYDPRSKAEKAFFTGKLVRIKKNETFDDILGRQEATRKIINEDSTKLNDEGLSLSYW
jgi:hypothetical protein